MKAIKQRVAEAHAESQKLDIDAEDTKRMQEVALTIGEICALATKFGARPGGKAVLDAIMVLSASMVVMVKGAANCRPGDEDMYDELAFSAAMGEEIGNMMVEAGIINPIERGTAS